MVSLRNMGKYLAFALFPVGLVAEQIDIYAIPQTSYASEHAYQDWSRAERWTLSKELSDIANYQRLANNWCELQDSGYDLFRNSSFYDEVQVAYFASSLAPISMLRDTSCQDLTQTDAMRRRQKAFGQFERSVVLQPKTMSAAGSVLYETRLDKGLTVGSSSSQVLNNEF